MKMERIPLIPGLLLLSLSLGTAQHILGLAWVEFSRKQRSSALVVAGVRQREARSKEQIKNPIIRLYICLNINYFYVGNNNIYYIKLHMVTE